MTSLTRPLHRWLATRRRSIWGSGFTTAQTDHWTVSTLNVVTMKSGDVLPVAGSEERKTEEVVRTKERGRARLPRQSSGESARDSSIALSVPGLPPRRILSRGTEIMAETGRIELGRVRRTGREDREVL